MNTKKSVIVIGGGAAGIFSANIVKATNPDISVDILEKTESLLSKVRISGGGRCNVTHACFDAKRLTTHYPRGAKELVGPFHAFQPKDMIEWLEARGVMLKTEEDGRMFPITDSSETIIRCFLDEANSLGVEIHKSACVIDLKQVDDRWHITLQNGESYQADAIIIATGSTPSMFSLIEKLGHTIAPPVPSLFTFNVPTSPLLDLTGISLDDVEVSLLQFKQRGPMLLTHWGFSGPAVLKLSAWAARDLHDLKYTSCFSINWIPHLSSETAAQSLLEQRSLMPHKQITNLFRLPKSLWKRFLQLAEIGEEVTWGGLSSKKIHTLATLLTKQPFQMEGKTTFKQEFVTCGGVMLKEIDFKTMESKLARNLFFAGEVLNIDGVTGGFNFQNAWTTGWLAGRAIGSRFN